MAFRLSEFEDKIGDIAHKITKGKEMILADVEEQSYQLWIEPDYLHIEKLDLNIYSADVCNFDFETEEYILDHNLYIFFNSITGEQVYYEGGSSLNVCIQNYCSIAGIERINTDDLECTYVLDNGKFLDEKVLSGGNFEIAG